MRLPACIVVACLLVVAPPASARTIHGQVYVDANRDGRPSAGEPGVAGAVVAYDVRQFVIADAGGQFSFVVPDESSAIVWVRIPDGYEPGPVWARSGPDTDRAIDLGVRPSAPRHGPLTFVVASDSHITSEQPFSHDLRAVATAATALVPAPAFFTLLGDITQGNQDAEFDLVDAQLADLGVPYVPVPGNHDWYDAGEAWFRRYGPDNYSFDIAGVHVVVWNMAMSDADIRAYLGRELALVVPTMPIIALTHAPPTPAVIAILRELGVDYVLTGHTHTNRVSDHDGLVELNTEPLLMGGLDFTPAGFRVVTFDAGRLATYHRTVVDQPHVAILAPAPGACVPATGGALIVAAELDASALAVHAQLDCATPIELRHAGGWNWHATLPALALGAHAITVEARAASGLRATQRASFEVCPADAAPRFGATSAQGVLRASAEVGGGRVADDDDDDDADWPQLGGAADHRGARARELPPPLVTGWTQVLGGHVLAAPVIAGGAVYVTATDLGRGDTGGVIALDLATGAIRWRQPLPIAVRGGPAVSGDIVAVAQIDGTVIGLDAATGALRWRHELGAGMRAEAAGILAAPTADGGDVLVGNQHALAVIAGATGTPVWTVDPMRDPFDFAATGSVAVGGGLVVGSFSRALGGVTAWDRATGALAWRLEGEPATAVNGSPVIVDDTVFLVDGADDAIAVELATGELRWQTRLDPTGFEWGNAIGAAPAYAHGVLVVPTLYGDLVALDARAGTELWRHAAISGPLRTTHYRGSGMAGFAASPVITGDIVWAADTSGTLVALGLASGHELWRTAIGAPVFGGLAISGDQLVVASYDGTIRAFATTAHPRIARVPPSCEPPPSGGCCEAGGRAPSLLVGLVVLALGRRRRRARAEASL